MKKNTPFLFLLSFLFMFSISAVAQNENVAEEKAHTISLSIGHVQVSKGFKDNKQSWLALPSWAFDYNFRIHPKWAIGWHNELVLSDFEVESNAEDGVVLERSHPLATMISVGYFPVHWMMFYVGGGSEIAAAESFGLVRLGIEPSVEISEKFELVFGANYDFKIDAYDSFGLSMGMAFKF